MKNHSRDRNGLKKNSSPVHHNILAPVPGPTPVHHRSIQAWHQQNLIEQLRSNEDIPKTSTEENCVKEDSNKTPQELQMITEENSDESAER